MSVKILTNLLTYFYYLQKSHIVSDYKAVDDLDGALLSLIGINNYFLDVGGERYYNRGTCSVTTVYRAIHRHHEY